MIPVQTDSRWDVIETKLGPPDAAGQCAILHRGVAIGTVTVLAPAYGYRVTAVVVEQRSEP